jgi:hypothetical protein
MPTKWKALFAVQGLITLVAIRIRLKDIERAKLRSQQMEERAEAERKNN